MGFHMMYSLIINDLKRNKVLNITLFLFIFISASLMATGVMAIERLTGALEQIYQIALPPHYMQMHVGPIDPGAIDRFAQKSGMVAAYDIQSMVNIDGVSIHYTSRDGQGGSLSGSLLDNYFVTQNKHLDFLLDTTNKVTAMAPSEIGIPLVYARKHHIGLGDRVRVKMEGQTFDFTVKAILRDAQMGSSMASSIRFLVHERDFKALSAVALRHETILAFLLKDPALINQFSDLYNGETSEMPKNGIAITLPLIKMVNSIGDGFMSGVMILVGILLMSIAMLNMGFSIQSTLEEEVREIGTLKAIGLSHKEIKQIYKSKYRLITLSACTMAGVAAFFMVPLFMENIALNFGLSHETALTYIAPFFAVTLLYMMAMVSLNKIMKVIGQMTIVNALVEGRMVRKKGRDRAVRIPKLRHGVLGFNFDFALSLHQFKVDMKSWRTFIVASFMCTLAILLPLNLYMTLTSPKFVNYVGSASSDVRMALAYQPELEGVLKALEKDLLGDPDIEVMKPFKMLKGKIERESQWVNFLIEAGNYQSVAIEMLEGNLPRAKNEIALSSLNADKLDLKLGESLRVALGDVGAAEDFKVVGIYQDITNGGLTAKISDQHGGEVDQYAFFIDLKAGKDLDGFVDKWGKAYPAAKVVRVDKLIEQTLGSITASLKYAVVAIVLMALVIIGLVAVLFLILRLHKNYSDNAILLAVGYEVKTLQGMYLTKSLFSCLLGAVFGLGVSIVIGEGTMSLILSAMAFGITSLKFIVSPMSIVAIGVIAPALVVGLITNQVTKTIARASVMHLGHE